MWTKEQRNEIDGEEPTRRAVEITLDEYREIVRENAGHDMAVRKKDDLISEPRRKVEKLANALSEIDRGGSDDGE